MKLPEADRAIIERAKVRDYLLSATHPVGRFKATFFAGLGYGQGDWELLEAELRRLAETEEAIVRSVTRYGQKLEVRGKIVGPGRRTATLVTVWIIPHGEEFPRLVTAYPGDA